AYLRDFYAERAELETQAYSTQHKILIDDCFGSSDFWTQALNKLDYQTADIVANAEPLQKRWARENDLSFDDKNWLFEIAAAQIKKFSPDVLLVADYSTFNADFLRNIKRECPSLRLVLGWCGAPYNDSSVFGEWDVVLSCIPELVDDFRSKGHRCFHVNHAFAPRILDKLDSASPPTVDFAFVGSILKQSRFHIERERILSELVRHTELQIWSEIKRATSKQQRNDFVRRKASEAVAAANNAGVPRNLINALPLVRRVARWKPSAIAEQEIDARIARRTRPPVFGVKMFQLLRDSRVVLNTHIDVSPLSASNMRLFEATGAGTCLLTDWKENLAQLFEPDKEVLTYRSAAECIEKIRYVLAREDERRAIAAAGQRRTLREHNFDDRAARIDEIIKEYFAARG
ncbi:MAG TPA: glycosyltransferase, partial [Pyrinomonadaceae bacterium]|nr:glycosyltransferase [Pyrinomonadaceae bacterium]